jgi:integrase
LLHQGENPKIVQERLGHSSPAFTLAVYSHVVPGMQEQAARRLAERLLGSDPEVGIAGDSKRTPGAV